MMYLGDYQANATIDFKWSSNNADGASVTRATNGEVRVYKANGTSETTTGVTDTEDFDSLTGIHHCRIATTDAFYATGNDYMVVLAGATIDGQTVNAVLAHFSIKNRYMRGTDSAYTGTPPTAAAIADQVWDEALAGHTTAGSAGDALSDASSAVDLWGTALPGSYTSGQAGYILGNMVPSLGPGAIPFTYTLTSSADSSPIVDADVWVTADAAGNTILANGRTDSDGEVTFYLDPGTVYIWRQKPGWNFDNPDLETID
jgi:hypothetical protein